MGGAEPVPLVRVACSAGRYGCVAGEHRGCFECGGAGLEAVLDETLISIISAWPVAAQDRVLWAQRPIGGTDTSAIRGKTVTAPTDSRGHAGFEVAAPVGRGQELAREHARLLSKVGSALVVLLPTAVAAAVIAVNISVPSYWRDEAATLAAVQRPLGALVDMLGNVDAVHGPYYLLVWPLATLFGTSELVMRLPSLIAMALTAGVVAATGRRLFSPAAGLAAGLLFAVVPNVSLYGQMARSYAMVTLAAAAASYLLARLIEDPLSRPGWIWYVVSLTMAGALNIFALLLIPAHALTVMTGFRHRPKDVRRAAFGRWLAAVGVALALNIPLLSLAFQQRVQISWVPPPSLESVGNALDLLGPPAMTVAIFVTILAGAVAGLASARAARAGLPSAGPGADGGSQPAPTGTTSRGWGAVLTLSLPWLVLPAAVLLATSVVTPVYTARYVIFCIPAGALIVGTALATIPRAPGWRLPGLTASLAAFAVIASLGLGLQVQQRQAAGHHDNIRAADMIVAANAEPGDVVYYPWPLFMSMSGAYPYGLGRLPDIQVKESAIKSGTLAGTIVSKSVLRRRLSMRWVKRVWVVDVNGDKSVARLIQPENFHLALTFQASDIFLQLWVRNPPWWNHYNHHWHQRPSRIF
jgi:mannosyltransferase